MYNSNVNNNISKLNPIKGIYLEKLDKILKNNLTNFYNIEIINFGSYKTELSIEGSDIDILIKYKPIQNQNTFVSDLIGILYQNKQEFDYIKPITTASVPVIKLQFDISKLININKIDDYLDYDDLNKLKFDISFKESDFYNNNFDKTINFIKKSIFDFPYVKDIVLLMKRYFKIIKLNKIYLGGLSSYSIFLMTLAFLKSKKYSKEISIGKQFYYFIEWYTLFNFTEFIIDVTQDAPFIKIDECIKNDKITIIDPINQSNVSKSSFKIEEIKNAFIKVFNIIKIDAWNMEQQNELDINNINNPLKILNTIFQIK
jgi:non-canonical poly(A) RNA polymerase PAPD5/7